MATWTKISTDNYRKKMVVTANSKSGYRVGVGINYRHFWSVPSSYYGYKRNLRANHLSSGSSEPAAPDHGSLPAFITYSTPLDYYFERKFTCTAGQKMKVAWHSSSSQVFDDDTKIYFAPIIIPPDTMESKRWTNHNGLTITNTDYEYLFANGYDGTSSTRGIVRADIGDIDLYTDSDASYFFSFEYTFPNTTTIEAGSGLLFLITNDQSTSSIASEYMRNFSVVIEGDVH